MEFNDLISELDQLQLPTDQYAITASGTLAIRNLRHANDLDIIVTPELWNKLTQTYPITSSRDFQSINIGNVQILGVGSYFTHHPSYDVTTQIQSADIIHGRRCVKLSIIRDFKSNRNQPKDIIDIQLIDNYLTNNPSYK